MIISTRESQAVRAAALQLGVSQISGGSRTSVGGYGAEARPHDTEQFDVSDQRTLDEVIGWLMDEGHLPSFCTACYRAGRTGDRFMEFCKSGQISWTSASRTPCSRWASTCATTPAPPWRRRGGR